MKTLSRIGGLVALGLGAVLYVEVKSMAAVMSMWIPKIVATAFSPLVALAGAYAALVGLCRRDRAATVMGALGAALAAFYVRRSMEPQDGLARAFGADWTARIPPERRVRFLDRRWRWPMPPTPQPRWDRDVSFWTIPGSERQLLCDLWQPPVGVPPSGLAYIYFHGSGWHFLDKDTGTRPIFRHLAAQGHVIMDVAYRLCPEVRFRDMIGDVKRAIAWMKTHAGDYGVDPGRIVLGGGSAGGHLALLAAYTPNHPVLDPADVQADTSVCGVISSYGPPDLKASYQYFAATFGPDGCKTPLDRWAADLERAIVRSDEMYSLDWMLRGLLGGSPEALPDEYALASPITHVGPHCPPTLLLQGAYDVAVRADTVRRLHAALREAGVKSIYIEFPFTDHGFDLALLEFMGPAAQAALGDVERFLALLAG